jgi:hypothetical protein
VRHGGDDQNHNSGNDGKDEAGGRGAGEARRRMEDGGCAVRSGRRGETAPRDRRTTEGHAGGLGSRMERHRHSHVSTTGTGTALGAIT